jgi:hypothetical protein
MRGYIEYWLEGQLKQDVDKRQQAVSSIPAAVEDILETTVVGNIHKMPSARKYTKGSYVPILSVYSSHPSLFINPVIPVS